MKPLLTPKVMRALLFVHTLNDQGVTPSRAAVNAFVEARTNLVDFDPYSDGLYPRNVDFLIDAKLLVSTRLGVSVTAAGQAILRADNEPSPGSAPMEVVGRMSDPFTYAQLLSRIDDVPDALLIDPYLLPQDLAAILKLASVKRVLTRNHHAGDLTKADREQKIRIALGARLEIDLRFIPPGSHDLHDRLVLPRGRGDSLFFGTSLGGTQLTVITRIRQDATEALQRHYEELWTASTPVDPIAREASGNLHATGEPARPAI